jgi:transposase InsO family protein
MCYFLKVSRSAYYAWSISSPSKRAIETELISERTKQIFHDSRKTYGTRRIIKGLHKQGFTVSRRRIAKLMQRLGLYCKTKKKFKVTTDSKHLLPVAANILNREFSVEQPNKCYVGDITYIYTSSGWLYLAVVIDLFSRKVVGWSMADSMKAELVNRALQMAISNRKPNSGLLWHTDRGSQYASDSHREILQKHGITQSMSRKGNCWDNAVSESFFHTLKTELVHHIKFKTKEEAKQNIFEFIEVFYNRVRMHSANDYLSPVEFEQAHIF